MHSARLNRVKELFERVDRQIESGGWIDDEFIGLLDELQHAIFEATHGTAPKYADKDVINPGSVILSGVMMFDFLGWGEAARMIETSLEATIQQKKVTYDFERLMPGATKVKTSEFADCLIDNMVDRRKKVAV